MSLFDDIDSNIYDFFDFHNYTSVMSDCDSLLDPLFWFGQNNVGCVGETVTVFRHASRFAAGQPFENSASMNEH